MPSVLFPNLPRHIASARLPPPDDNTQVDPAIYDVKFYPYYEQDDDPVFAATGGRHILICRPSLDNHDGMEIIQWFKEKDPNAGLNSLVWSKDVEKGTPLLCVAGNDRTIKVFDAITKEIRRILVGHGAAINDLAGSPTSPNIIASASEDKSIRIWNISPEYEKHPCQVICAGEGHTGAILTLAFHDSGKFLLSGGMDNRINMWAIPDLPDKNANTDNTTVVLFPHFSTFEVHYDYVDCVTFFGDLIISKCVVKEIKDGHILLWKIEDFSSSDPFLKPAPTFYKDGAESRSAFGSGHRLLLSFKSPVTESYYMRFGLFHQPNKHPILAMANAKTEVSFWDLQSLESDEPPVFLAAETSAQQRKRRAKGNDDNSTTSRITNQHHSLVREDSVVSSTSSGTTQPSSSAASMTKNKKWDVGDPFTPLEPHKKIVIPQFKFRARGIAWSRGGEWCVVVGDQGMISLFHRQDPE